MMSDKEKGVDSIPAVMLFCRQLPASPWHCGVFFPLGEPDIAVCTLFKGIFCAFVHRGLGGVFFAGVSGDVPVQFSGPPRFIGARRAHPANTYLQRKRVRQRDDFQTVDTATGRQDDDAWLAEAAMG